MKTFIALFRGINVGGHNKLPMADLRAAVSACGYEAVETYIQSGNVVFQAGPSGAVADVADDIADAIEAAHGLSVPVTVRTRDELAALVADNPFLDGDDDPKHHHVLFRLAAGEPVLGDLADSFEPECAAAHRRDVYLHLPSGIGRSPLAVALGRRSDLDGTVRNWRTTNKLLELADGRR
jgi:uncharacterized protein (DUF1697 family)